MIQGNRFSCNVYDPLDQSLIKSWILGISFVRLKGFDLDFWKKCLSSNMNLMFYIWKYQVNFYT